MSGLSPLLVDGLFLSLVVFGDAVTGVSCHIGLLVQDVGQPIVHRRPPARLTPESGWKLLHARGGRSVPKTKRLPFQGRSFDSLICLSLRPPICYPSPS